MTRALVIENIVVPDEWNSVEDFLDFSGGDGTMPTKGGLVHLLSEDPDTGARTTLLKLPAGWSMPNGVREKHTHSQETILLSGELSFNDIELKGPAYISMPGGTLHGPVRMNTDCLMIAIAYGPFDVTYEDDEGAAR